ncbi:hypothetical protein RQL62_03340 [Citrobacter amalonaticus]|nr:hypothetical protein [Citrobacter amalonaticus]
MSCRTVENVTWKSLVVEVLAVVQLEVVAVAVVVSQSRYWILLALKPFS